MMVKVRLAAYWFGTFIIFIIAIPFVAVYSIFEKR